jgi:hypothetical protein
MARRGRPRNPNAKRRETTVAGRLPDRDHGTVAAQLRRAEAVGASVLAVDDGRVLVDRDTALSASQLGVLLARGMLDRRRFDAGLRYQELAWAAYGRPFARAVDIGRPRGDGLVRGDEIITDSDDGRRTGARQALTRADAWLAREAGGAALLAVKRLCQFDQPLSADGLPPLERGLGALALIWERGSGRPRTGP